MRAIGGLAFWMMSRRAARADARTARRRQRRLDARVERVLAEAR